MKKLLFTIFLAITGCATAIAQSDSIMVGVFDRITAEVQNYRIDTSEAPDDKITRKIVALRDLRGGFNINEAIMFKLGEEEKKKETPEATLTYLRQQFSTGKGKQWLDNAANHIYRNQFTYRELKQLVRFYKTSAGQKLAHDFPYIMMKTLMAAQIIHDVLVNEQKK